VEGEAYEGQPLGGNQLGKKNTTKRKYSSEASKKDENQSTLQKKKTKSWNTVKKEGETRRGSMG